jgi:hypothetical protein
MPVTPQRIQSGSGSSSRCAHSEHDSTRPRAKPWSKRYGATLIGPDTPYEALPSLLSVLEASAVTANIASHALPRDSRRPDRAPAILREKDPHPKERASVRRRRREVSHVSEHQALAGRDRGSKSRRCCYCRITNLKTAIVEMPTGSPDTGRRAFEDLGGRESVR